MTIHLYLPRRCCSTLKSDICFLAFSSLMQEYLICFCEMRNANWSPGAKCSADWVDTNYNFCRESNSNPSGCLFCDLLCDLITTSALKIDVSPPHSSEKSWFNFSWLSWGGGQKKTKKIIGDPFGLRCPQICGGTALLRGGEGTLMLFGS